MIRLDYMRAEDPRSLTAGFTVMRGQYRHRPGAQIAFLTLYPETGRTEQELIPGEVEFPRVDPRVVGCRYQHLLTLTSGL